MGKGSKAFGLIELMISLVIMTIVMVGIYRYWIKGVQRMTDSVTASTVKSNTYFILESIANDLKLIGFNPTNEVDSSNRPLFGITAHPSPYDSLTFSSYNSDTSCLKPAWDTANCTTVSGVTTCASVDCTSISCVCTQYSVDSNFNLLKTYFDSSSASTKNQILARNVCVRFLYCDSDTNASCSDQDGEPPPTSIKLILAVAANESDLTNFDGNCFIPSLDPSKYVRFEKKIYLSNLHR